MDKKNLEETYQQIIDTQNKLDKASEQSVKAATQYGKTKSKQRDHMSEEFRERNPD